MDMFSFGLILYFLETGYHYWDGENEEKKEEIISTKYLPLRNIGPDHTACYVIKSLLDKSIPHRMTLEGFIQTSYYISESSKQKKLTNINNNKFEPDDEIIEEELQAKLTQEVQENYHYELFNVLDKNFMLNSIQCQNSISNYNGFNKFYKKRLTYLLEYIFKILSEVHLYNRLLWLIVRYCSVKDHVVNNSLAKKTSILYRDIIEINSTIKAGKSFNSHLSKLIIALESRDNKKIQCELNRSSIS
ncbi:unnamed protein product [Rhizophagus irregularis]|nr:unnamed protein product [Rhizophagus irregularis]